MWHSGRLYKLTKHLLLDFYIHFIASFLPKRTFRVKLNGGRKEKLLTAGEPLETVLGLACFYLCTSTTCKIFLKPDRSAEIAVICLQDQLHSYVAWAGNEESINTAQM